MKSTRYIRSHLPFSSPRADNEFADCWKLPNVQREPFKGLGSFQSRASTSNFQ